MSSFKIAIIIFIIFIGLLIFDMIKTGMKVTMAIIESVMLLLEGIWGIILIVFWSALMILVIACIIFFMRY
ncbi:MULTISPECIES: hypothetical protein [Fusobacterium]|uniref:hypothetical protein n=1 Tax=Fusobacterium TaxID=848 RepID=UPI0008A3EB2A|nr:MULTISPECIES: hypothetical protein [Fusobacterium]MCI6032258.1 hypothetical protein [Fusobacterium varium]OFL82737.1 hypothetical protein HMPREF2747_12630 [Fusobacterium sp. HMSC073F01]RGJ27968.1 hypothetical protein DXD66_08500 [Fusobacterium varium]